MADEYPPRGFNSISHRPVALRCIPVNDQSSARFQVTVNILKRARRIIGVVNHADAKCNIEFLPEIHTDKISLHELDIGEVFHGVARQGSGEKVYCSHCTGNGSHQQSVVAAATPAFKYVLVAKGFKSSRCNPRAKLKFCIIGKLGPL